MASFRNFCDREGVDFDQYWSPDSTTELYHFVGKDILYFHALFWPAMLHGAGFRRPTAVFVHGFLTVNGQKMSKSRGTFIKARTYLNHLDPDYLRYYFAAKLNARVEDIDLNLNDFTARVNSDLVGKVVNIASRCAGFINQRFDGQLAATLPDPALFEHFIAGSTAIAQALEDREFGRAMRQIIGICGPGQSVLERATALDRGKGNRSRGKVATNLYPRPQPVPNTDDLVEPGGSRTGSAIRNFSWLPAGRKRCLADFATATARPAY